MTEKRYSVRLVSEGGAAVRAEFDGLAQSVQRAMGNAEKSAGVFEGGLERLRLKFDPLYASSMRYAQQVEELNRAQAMGVNIAGGYEAALERINAEYALSARASQIGVANLGLMTRASFGVGDSMRRAAPYIQQASFQVQDFAVQVAAGTDVSRAFAQQAPALLGAIAPMGSRLAAIGALIGVIVAVGVPLIAMLMDTGEEAQTLEDRLEGLERALRDYQSSARDTQLSTAELTERYGSATGAARAFLAAQLEINRVRAYEGLRSTLAEIAGGFGGLNSNVHDAHLGIDELSVTIDTLQEKLQLTHEQALEVARGLLALDAADGPTAAAEAAQRLLTALEASLGPYEDMNAEARTLYEQVREAGERATELKAAAEAATGALASATSQAQRIADELTRAVGAAGDLASASITDLARAQIEFDFRDDPIRRAGALAAAQFDARTTVTSDMPDGALNYLQRQRDLFVSNAEAAARLNEQTRIWRDEQRQAARGGRAEARAEERFSRQMAEQIEAAQFQLDMIGRTSAEIAEMTARQEALNDARRLGLDLDREMSGTGETLIEQIDRQAAAIGRLTAETEKASERADFFSGIQDDLKDGLLDALVAGEDFSDVLDDVARALQRAAFQALLFGEGPLAGLFGGGGGGKGGGLLGGLLASIFHDGGTVGTGGRSRDVSPSVFLTAPRMHRGGLAGLAADEVPAILQRGERVLSRAEVAAQGRSGVRDVNVRVTVDRNGNLLAFVEDTARGMINEARPQMIRDSVAATYAAAGEVPLR